MDVKEYVKCFPRWQFRAIEFWIEYGQFKDNNVHLKSYQHEVWQNTAKIIQKAVVR